MIFTAGRNIEPTQPVSPARIALLERQRRAAEARILHPTPDTPDVTSVGVIMNPDEFGKREPDKLTFESKEEVKTVAKVAHAIGYPALADVLEERAHKADELPSPSETRLEVLTLQDEMLVTEAFHIAGMVNGMRRAIQTSEGVETLPSRNDGLDPTLTEVAIQKQYLTHYTAA